MRVEAADHEAAAMEVDERGKSAGIAWGIDPHRNLAGRAGERAALDARHRLDGAGAAGHRRHRLPQQRGREGEHDLVG